jgi:hypothetical protein
MARGLQNPAPTQILYQATVYLVAGGVVQVVPLSGGGAPYAIQNPLALTPTAGTTVLVVGVKNSTADILAATHS